MPATGLAALNTTKAASHALYAANVPIQQRHKYCEKYQASEKLRKGPQSCSNLPSLPQIQTHKRTLLINSSSSSERLKPLAILPAAGHTDCTLPGVFSRFQLEGESGTAEEQQGQSGKSLLESMLLSGSVPCTGQHGLNPISNAPRPLREQHPSAWCWLALTTACQGYSYPCSHPCPGLLTRGLFETLPDKSLQTPRSENTSQTMARLNRAFLSQCPAPGLFNPSPGRLGHWPRLGPSPALTVMWLFCRGRSWGAAFCGAAGALRRLLTCGLEHRLVRLPGRHCQLNHLVELVLGQK